MEAKTLTSVPGKLSEWTCLKFSLSFIILLSEFNLECQCSGTISNTNVTPPPNVIVYSVSSVPFTHIPYQTSVAVPVKGAETLLSRNFNSQSASHQNFYETKQSLVASNQHFYDSGRGVVNRDHQGNFRVNGYRGNKRRSSRWPFPFRLSRRRFRLPPFKYSHPHRRPWRLRRLLAPSKIHEWQIDLMRRFDNHKRLADRRQAENAEARGYTDTFMSAAMMPLSFMAFSMLFMDIVTRLFPWSLGKTTPTTPPPKMTRIEYNPPTIPSIKDLLGEVKNQIISFKDLKKGKKKKIGHWTDWRSSSEEEQWDDHRERVRNKKRSKSKSSLRKRKSKPKLKKKKKKKYNSQPLTLDRLHELFVKHRPSFI